MQQENETDLFNLRNCYKVLARHMMPMVEVPLAENEINALAGGEISGDAVDNVLFRIDIAKRALSGFSVFPSTDFCAPTDSPRFLSPKRGATASARSAWISLANSEKVRLQAANGRVSAVCLRQFKVFDVPKEFRLFIRNGQLFAMSQRYLVRHFNRLDRRADLYLDIAQKFIMSMQTYFRNRTLCIDIYITAGKKVIVIDVNPWGAPTDPLLLKDWNIGDSELPRGFLIIPPENQNETQPEQADNN